MSAKLLCPGGRFLIDAPGASAFDGTELALHDGTVTMGGTCTAAGRRYLQGMNRWLHVVARWNRCHGRSMVMRGRFDAIDYCNRISGTIRKASGRRVRFVATRIEECGNEVREPGEQCDGQDGTFFGMDCCTADCRVKPDCPITCNLVKFPCEGADEICALTCGWPGVCWKRAEVDCTERVCGCDGKTTYANRCEAFEAGSGVGHLGACTP